MGGAECDSKLRQVQMEDWPGSLVSFFFFHMHVKNLEKYHLSVKDREAGQEKKLIIKPFGF